jgi:chromosomal replication initiator protein
VSDQQQVWTAVAQLLRAQLTESVWFSTFSEVVPVADTRSRDLVIQVPSTLARDRILTRYLPLITDALAEAGEGDRRFDVVISTPDPIAAEPVPIPGLGDGPYDLDDQRVGANGMGSPETVIDAAGLNPRYTFETFVKGASNQFALAAALRVAETPGPFATTRCSSTARPGSARRTCSTPSATTCTTTTSTTWCGTSPPRRS